MRSLHVVQHVPGEGPGRIAEVATEMGLTIVTHRPFEGEAVPASIPRDAGLVVMGGSMGVGDVGDPRWPFLAAETELIARCLREERPILGVCLGAQLLAHALGAAVRPLTIGDPPVPCREVGWGAVTFVVPPGSDAILEGLDESEVVLHWHGDTFDLPPGATRLASTLACENQMFRFGTCTFGVQFHVEVGSNDVTEWVHGDADFVRLASGPGGARRILADTARFMPRHRQVGQRIIGNLLSAMAGAR
jgi:GMP synthase (glutamine-hydrolysing)